MVTKHHWIEKIPGIVGSMTPCLPVSVWSPVSAEAASSNAICAAEVSFWSLEISKLGWFWAFFPGFCWCFLWLWFVSEAAPATSAEVDALAEKLDLRLERLNAAWQGPRDLGWMGEWGTMPALFLVRNEWRNYTFGRSKKNKSHWTIGCPNFVGFERFDPQQIPILMEKTRLWTMKHCSVRWVFWTSWCDVGIESPVFGYLGEVLNGIFCHCLGMAIFVKAEMVEIVQSGRLGSVHEGNVFSVTSF